jgi:hypothetical protein
VLQRTLFILSLALVVTAILAAPASAAVYKSARDGFGITLRVEGNRITEWHIRYMLHCSDGRVRRGAWNSENVNVRVNRRTGRFVYQHDVFGDGITIWEKVQGTAHPRLVTGTFRVRFRDRIGGGTQTDCWTGRRDNAKVRFAARRL